MCDGWFVYCVEYVCFYLLMVDWLLGNFLDFVWVIYVGLGCEWYLVYLFFCDILMRV